MRRIELAPCDIGWSVRLPDGAEPMVFLSGRAAEAAARGLAARLSDAGESVDLIIRLRDGSLAARLRYRPLWPAEALKAA